MKRCTICGKLTDELPRPGRIFRCLKCREKDIQNLISEMKKEGQIYINLPFNISQISKSTLN